MITDVQINAMDENLPILVNDKTADCERLIGIELGMGAAQILLTVKNAVILQQKLQKEIVRQKAEMVGEGMIRLLAKREWVERILVRPSGDEVLVFVQVDAPIELALAREVMTIGSLVGQAAEVTVNANLTPLNENTADGEIEVYARSEKGPAEEVKEEPAPASHC